MVRIQNCRSNLVSTRQQNVTDGIDTLILVKDARVAVIVPKQSQFWTACPTDGDLFSMEQKETCRYPPKIPNFRVAGLDLSHMRAVTSVCKHPMSASVFWRFVPNSRILDREILCNECANSYRPRKTWSKNKPGHSASSPSVETVRVCRVSRISKNRNHLHSIK